MGLHESSIPCPPGSVWHYFLCHYLPFTSGLDAPSRSLLKFKRGAQPDLDAWTDCALTSLREIKPPFSRDTVIVRALHHHETRVPAPIQQTSSPRVPAPTHQTPGPAAPIPGPALSALDHLGHAIANQFQCAYLPSLLTKTRPTHPNKELTVEQRIAELQDIYSAIADPTLTSTTPFLLIDDLLTTGVTARTIIGALRLQFPDCPIRVFTLGKVDHEAGVSPRSPLVGNIFRLDDTAGWKQSC